MDLKGKKIGVALTGSFCTFEKIFKEMEKLAQLGADIYPLFSNASQSIENRFGKPEEFMERAAKIAGREPICSIEAAEPIGPQGLSGYYGDSAVHWQYCRQTGKRDYGHTGSDGGQGASEK